MTDQSRTPPHRPLPPLILSVVGALVLWVGLLATHVGEPRFTGDTTAIVNGLQDARVPGAPFDWLKLSYFSVFAHVLVGGLLALGGSATFVYRSLVVLNALSFGEILMLGYRSCVRRGWPFAAQLWLLGLAGSPLCYYAFNAAIEPLVALFTLLFVASLIERWPPASVCGLAALAGVAKETNPLLMTALAGVVWFIDADRRDPRLRRGLLGALGGCALAFAANSLFNLLRFGSVENAFYSLPILRVSDPRVFADNVAALWVSPNGGILVHWPIFVVAALGLVVAPRRWRGVGMILAFTAAVLLGLAAWHSPFGWIAWSNRLIVPWMPALVLLLIATGRDSAATAPHQSWSLIATLWVFAAGLPQIGATFAFHAEMLACRGTAACPKLPGFWDDVPYYYRCLQDYFWRNWDSSLLLCQNLLTRSALHLVVAFTTLGIAAALSARVLDRSRTLG